VRENGKKDGLSREGLHVPEDPFIDAMLEKDRKACMGSFVHGLIHNVNGLTQNLSMLVDILARGQGKMDGMVREPSGVEPARWEEMAGKQARRLETFSEQLDLLTDMLRQLMLLHETETTPSRVDVNALLERLAHVFRADLFFKHQVEVEFRLASKLPLISVPGRDLVPALVHLFENGVTALRTAPSKRLILESRGGEDGIRLCIGDTGCGLPEDLEIQELFEPFRSAWPQDVRKEASRNFQGLGLYIARRFLNPHNVSIGLGREGDRTLAWVDIPCPE